MESGIYCIENLVNGKRYIGQSENLFKRKIWHFSILNKKEHFNLHLQNAFDRYGKENFIFKILIYCEIFELTRYEQFFVNLYTPEILYNIRLECVNSNLGTKHSEESRKKISGKNNPNYGKTGENSPNFGRKHTAEELEKASKAIRGKIVSEETKRKLSKINTGKHHSEETKRKISENSPHISGINHPMYGKKSIFYGKKHKDESKEKMSKAKIGKYSGENNPKAKLKENEILDILDLFYNQKFKVKEISNKYFNKVSLTYIYYILNRKTWISTYDKFMKERRI